MDNSPICTKMILPQSNSKQIKCQVCYSVYHIKCLSLCPDDHEHMRGDDILLCELNGISIDEHTIGSLVECLFNPFQLNDKDYYTPLSEVDPDVNFYNNINSHLVLNCNSYLENSAYDLMRTQTNCLSTDNVFSLCHINIHSLWANLPALELTLDNLRIHFTAIGVSETLLNDHIWDLYHIEGYDLIEVHRHSKRGGGVGIFLNNNIPHQIRTDIFLKDDVAESIFIEIDKDVFKRGKISS